MYIGELTKIENTGKQSPGPQYCYADEIKFETAPGWSMGTQARNG